MTPMTRCAGPRARARYLETRRRMQTACCWQFWFSDRFTGARNPARLPTTDAIPSNPLRPPSAHSLPSKSENACRGSTTSPATALPETGTRKGEELTPLYHVVLLDDDEHTYDYVVEMLTKIFCLSSEAAFRQRGGSGHHGPDDRDHVRAGAGRIRARPDSRLRSGPADAGLQRLHERDCGAGQRLTVASAGRVTNRAKKNKSFRIIRLTRCRAKCAARAELTLQA